MSDWANIEIQDFDTVATSDNRLSVLVGQLILERLPFAFQSKGQYLNWKDRLAQGLGIDGRDVYLVGSACTGRSLSARSQFKIFRQKSDLDIAVVSQLKFDEAWKWFRDTNPDLLNLDDERTALFFRHRDWNIFHGFIASEYFLSYFDFGNEWIKHLQMCEEHLPEALRGRRASIRIYRDAASLRLHLSESMRIYRKYKGIES